MRQGGPVAVNSDFWSLLYTLRTQKPDWSSEVIGHYLNRRLTLSLAAGQPNPFDDKTGTIPDSQLDDQVLIESARGAPAVFVKEVLPFMLEVMKGTASPRSDGMWLDPVWEYRFYHGGHRFEDALIRAMEVALSEWAARYPDPFRSLIKPMSESQFETIQFLLIRSFSSNGASFAGEAVDYLCDRPERLRIGYYGDPHWAARKLIEAISAHCSDEKLRQLEELLLGYYPKWEKSKTGRKLFGSAQFVLLSGTVAARRSRQVTIRLEELKRKFGEQEPEPPEMFKVGRVGSPVPEYAVDKMTDEQWLLAISQYNSDKAMFERGGRMVGGARELARLLQNQVTQEPGRFAELVLKFPDDGNPSYFEAVLRGIAEAGLDPDTVLRVCERCHRLPGRPCGRWICDPIAHLAEQSLPQEALDIVAWYATEDPDPEQSWDSEGSGRDILTEGINTVRGRAAQATGKLIYHDGNRIPYFQPTLARLVQDPSIAVRSCTAEALLAVLRHDRDLAVSLFQQLCHKEDKLLQTHYVERFLYFALQTHFQALSPVLERMVKSEIPETASAGARQACLAALELEEASPLAELCLTGTEAQRIGAAQVMAANVRTARFRSFCEESLINQFNDPNEEVRAKASDCFRHFEGDELGEFASLIEEFINSEAFPANYHFILRALEGTTARLPEVTCLACERFIQAAGAEAADISTRHAGEVDAVIQLTMRVYQQSSDKPGQERSLDLIDKLMELGVYGIDRALESFDR